LETTVESAGDQHAQAKALIRGGAQKHIMWITDGHGGMLALDTSNEELCWLARGCRLLLDGDPLGAHGAIKVTAGQAVYWLSKAASEGQRGGADRVEEIRIASLYDPCQAVRLPRDLVEMVADLIEQLSAP
jgi:hypothetical protein